MDEYKIQGRPEMGHDQHSVRKITSGDNVVIPDRGFIRSGQTDYNTGVGFWLGNSGGVPKFSLGNSSGDNLTWNGSVLDITGSVTADSGTIGGFTIGSTTITATNLTLDSSGQRISLGSGNDIIILDADDATYRLWIGNATAASAPFRVEKDGSVTATDISITSGDLTGTMLNSGSVDTEELVSSAVTTDKLAAGAVTAEKIDVDELSAISADLGTITAGTITLPSGGHVKSGQTAYDTGTGFWLGNDSGTVKFSIGDDSGDKLTWDGSKLAITGELTATTGTIGGFTIGSTSIAASNLTLDSSGQRITLGSGNDVVILDADDSTNRLWIGHADAGSAPFVVSKSGVVTANNIVITGGSVDASLLNGLIEQANLDVSNNGWSQTCEFSVVDSNTVAWGAGTFTSADGNSYSISAGNTGDMSAKTYIYLDTGTSTTAYQTTTTASAAVGAGKVLVAIAQNGTGEATFQVINGQGGQNIDASSIVAGSITANELAAGSVTASKITVTDLASISANLGAITAGTIALSSGGYIRSGQTAYNTGTGFWLGNDGGTPKLSIGDSGGDSLTWDGSKLDISGHVSAGSLLVGQDSTVITIGVEEGPPAVAFIRSGQTDYDDGIGFWLGAKPDQVQFSVGNSDGNKFTFDGTRFVLKGEVGIPGHLSLGSHSGSWSGAPVTQTIDITAAAWVAFYTPTIELRSLDGMSDAHIRLWGEDGDLYHKFQNVNFDGLTHEVEYQWFVGLDPKEGDTVVNKFKISGDGGFGADDFFVIDTSGNVTLYGSTTLGTSTSAHVINGTISHSYIANSGATGLEITATSPQGTKLVHLKDDSSIIGAGSYYILAELANGTDRFYVRGDGNVYAAGTLTVAGHGTTASAANAFLNSSTGLLSRSTSSLRYKKDTQPMLLEDARNIVLNAEPITYKSLCESDDPEKVFIGFAAEQIATIDPRLVEYTKDTFGRPQPEAVCYSSFVVPLTLMIQDYEKRITALEEKLRK